MTTTITQHTTLATALQQSPIFGVTAAEADATAADMESTLTPDALMTYCQSRLSNIDVQMRQMMAQQKTNNETIQEIHAVMSQLGAAQIDDQSKVDSLKRQLSQLLDRVGADSAVGRQIAGAMATLGTGNDGTVSPDEIKSINDALNGACNDVNSDGELGMIRLQSLMSSRQTAVQLTTNLVQALGDQMKKIADNIGH